MGVLIPSVMALCETAMTAPLGQQGEPRAANGRPFPPREGKGYAGVHRVRQKKRRGIGEKAHFQYPQT